MSNSNRPEGSQHSSSTQQTTSGYASLEQRLKYISDCKFLKIFSWSIYFDTFFVLPDNFPFCDESSKYEKVAKIGQGTFG